MPAEILKRFRVPGILLGSVLLAGTLGYWFLTGFEQSLLDCLYMTVITVLTIGFTEVIDSSHNPSIRVFTMVLALMGVGTATYILSNITAVIVEGDLKDTFRKRRTKKIIRKMEKHYIVCGAGRVGSVIINELFYTGAKFIIVDQSESVVKQLQEKYPAVPVFQGDASLEETLIEAEIKTASGIFAATGDDNNNVVISLTAKDLNPGARVIARCLEPSNHNKMRKAGADSVIIENFIAGMRMSSEMVRPNVTTFLDRMFVDSEKNLRVEEININNKHSGKRIAEFGLNNLPYTMLLAVVSKNKWTYNPKEEHVIEDDCRLVVITNPEEHQKLRSRLNGE
jgi:voltage-gated potassium channel